MLNGANEIEKIDEFEHGLCEKQKRSRRHKVRCNAFEIATNPVLSDVTARQQLQHRTALPIACRDAS